MEYSYAFFMLPTVMDNGSSTVIIMNLNKINVRRIRSSPLANRASGNS
jgi:hypothetical protein